jgi:glycosyltransferase involved in cell wall biosynthesis
VSEPDIPLGIIVCARNEERSLGACLDSWTEAVGCWQDGHADDSIPVLVVLDDCTDRSDEIAAARRAKRVASTGGKVSAQCAGLRALLADKATDGMVTSSSFVICSDADVLVEPTMIASLCAAMARPEVHVAFPCKRPLAPSRPSRLARAICRYNEQHGYSSQRSWFPGLVFAIRVADLVFPTPVEIATRAKRWPSDSFLQLEKPLRVEDVYLSQAIVAAHGPASLREVASCAWFRGPETLHGMFLKYRRMRLELERIRRLFPEFATVQKTYGQRRYDRLPHASLGELIDFGLFQAAVLLCRADYRLKRAYHRHLAGTPCTPWPPIEETKLKPGDAIASSTSNGGMPSKTGTRLSNGESTPVTPNGSRRW